MVTYLKDKITQIADYSSYKTIQKKTLTGNTFWRKYKILFPHIVFINPSP
nr:hypothetical protein BAR15_130113 [Bartonella sp. AR 15-3]